MEYCPHCMKPSPSQTCPHCGGNLQWVAPASQLPLGTQLRSQNGGVYMLGAARGQGGFGITYAAMDLRTGERVAIKEYYPTLCANRAKNGQVLPLSGQQNMFSGGMRSFLEEAMMLSAVQALKSVVSVRDYFQANGTAYIVMEFVDGVPLHEVLRKQGPMSADELLPKLPRLLEDLNTMHIARVIHRDISPDNLILMPDGTLKLLDFGSARSVQNGKSMTVMLKQGFSPVEQYQSKGQGPYTDVYALAATIYYCLTGVVPPKAVERLNGAVLVPPTQHGAKLTHAQEQALLWGMTVQPKSRPQTMQEFAEKLCPKKPDIIPWSRPKTGGSPLGSGSMDTDKMLLIGAVIVGGLLLMAGFIAVFASIIEAL